MVDLLGELVDYAEDSAIILFMVFAVVVLTVITHFRYRNRNKSIKYLPGVFVLLLGIFNLLTILDSLVDYENLDILMRFVAYGVSGLVGILAAFILGIYEKPVKKKKKTYFKENKETKKEHEQKT